VYEVPQSTPSRDSTLKTTYASSILAHGVSACICADPDSACSSLNLLELAPVCLSSTPKQANEALPHTENGSQTVHKA
jgi:hypothetical protein